MTGLRETRRAILETAQAMDRAGLTEGTAGNLSARAETGEIVLTPTALGYAGMVDEDLVVVDLDGRKLDGFREPTTEWQLHLACLRAHPEISAVVHTHPVHASMFAVNHASIPCVLEEFEFYVGGDVPVAPYQRTGTKELGNGVARLLEDRAAALLANHGLVVVAGRPAEGLSITRLVERAAEIIWGALAVGRPQELPAAIRSEFAQLYRERRHRKRPPGSQA
jgi:L-fuculose-phosphate aldolase